MTGDELALICVAVMMSSKVDSGLETWLKKYLQYDDRREVLQRASRYKGLYDTHPELEVKLRTLLGLQGPIDDDSLPIL